MVVHLSRIELGNKECRELEKFFVMSVGKRGVNALSKLKIPAAGTR